MIAQLMLSLSILVVLHELGHFLPARWFGCRVEKFYLFFDPYFSLFKKKIGETEWGVGWLPLGGYVKISGMVDESLDMAQLEGPPQPWEFRAKPAWQRLIIMLGGVTVNFVLGFLIFAGMLWYWGTDELRISDVPQGIYAEPFGQQYGLQNGDQVVQIGDRKLEQFGDQAVKAEILFNAAREMRVLRNGEEVVITLPDSLQRNLGKEQYKNCRFFSLPLKPIIDTIIPNTPAALARLQKGDRILAINGLPVKYHQQVFDVLKMVEPNSTLDIHLQRGDGLVRVQLPLGNDKKIGYGPNAEKQFDVSHRDYSLAEAIPAGVKSGLDKLAKQGQAVTQMFRRNIDAGDSVGSFISIGKAFGGEWNWQSFWGLTGLLSLILAVMNILPIPALDGGHVLFLLYEVVTGRKPSDKFLQYATTIGFGLVLLLMAFALFNDFRKLGGASVQYLCS